MGHCVGVLATDQEKSPRKWRQNNFKNWKTQLATLWHQISTKFKFQNNENKKY